MKSVTRVELVHEAVRRLVRTHAIKNVLDFYARTKIQSELKCYVLDEVERFKQLNSSTR